ncbi:MAG TPA: sugar phosphate isomerase/epimerase family protein [Gemmataceae bacterium]|nr:sugar phosphate isomerase/epimerase family protein [Gemmataceae bacterium]
MKIAIDSYCYHRYFGEIYAGLQTPADRTMTVWDFLRRARRLGVDGVSLESCFLPTDTNFLRRLRDTLDGHGFERVWAWGHPDGLRSGTDRQAARDLVAHLGHARAIGACVMRIAGGSRRTRPASFARHKRQLGAMLRKLLPAAEDHGVVLALENHLDLTADEMVDLVRGLDSPWLGVCLDTGNNLRLHEDPLAVAEKLAPLARATHVKDIGVRRGNPKEFAFWPSVPLGAGLVDIPRVVTLLREAGYAGLLAIEVDYLHPDHGDEDRAVRASVNYLKRVLADGPARKRP